MLRIYEMIGPVVLGIKSGELVNFSKEDKKIYRDKEQIKKTIDKSNIVKYREVKTPLGCTKIFFYHLKLLDKILSNKENQDFLESLGYPKNLNYEEYIDLLIEKIENSGIPHEIGLFLGYPLKDVKGFMGDTTLKLVKTKGWKVYGNPLESDLLYKKISESKKLFKGLLMNNSPDKLIELVG